MKTTNYFFLCGLLLCLFGFQSPNIAIDEAPLFASENIVHIRLKADFKAILKDRGEEREYHPATIVWDDSMGSRGQLPLKLKVRGNFRRDKKNCAFPPLRLNFDKDSTGEGLFQGQDKIKLVTHCQSGGSYQQYILQEYLMYKIYNQLTDYSFKVRLLKVVYEDESGRIKPIERYGFFIEDEKALAKRHGAGILESKGVHPDETNKDMEVLMSMYQFMIANTDFSVPGMHNVKMLRITEGEKQSLVAVPYDFDWCGMINTPYAVPSQNLGLTSVRQRLYRGFCATDEQWANTIARFNEEKADIYSEYELCPDLKPKTRKQALKFLDDFYEIINTEKRRQREMIRQCR